MNKAYEKRLIELAEEIQEIQEANDMALEIYDWIKENYISKQSLITQIKELDQEPTRQGIINLIEKL